jgi:aspartate/methionine/tyrosine aminotransferase
MAGDETLVQSLLLARKHLGLIMPAPIQAAVASVLRDDVHVSSQRELYSQRRQVVFGALRSAGFQIDHSEAGLYAWVTRGEDCWATVEWFAERGVLVAPGVFYGEAGSHHVRVALTASDEACDAFAQRLGETG